MSRTRCMQGDQNAEKIYVANSVEATHFMHPKNWRAKQAHSFFMSLKICGLYKLCIGRNFEISLRRRGIVNGMRVHYSAQK